MKRVLLIIFPISFYCNSNAQQNLLPDGGFEILNPCYDTGTYYSLGDIRWFQYWWNGNTGSADGYYKFSCTPSNTQLIDYPVTIGGSQYPRTDTGFAGIIAGGKPTWNQNGREYLQTRLVQPLTAGIKYYGGFYVNLGENGRYYSVNNLGAFLTDTMPDPTTVGNGGMQGVLNEVPQIMNDTTRLLDDTLGWILVADTFVAQGGELYL